MAVFSWPYRQDALPGFWGDINSKANFCEEDYVITYYIAELINTLTNLTYVLYAIRGIRANGSRKDAFLRNLPYLGIMGVGIGSAIFHSTLKYYTQWCDDLSMLIAVATVMHRVYTFDQTISTTFWSGVALTSALTAFSFWHCITDEIVMHSMIFGIMICLVGIQTRSIISHRIPDPAVRKEVKKLATWGAVIFISGYGIWNVDNALCSFLTETKREWGMPWSFLLELHGWWHIFTGVGAYIFIALVEYLTSDDAGKPLGGRFAWPVGMIVNCSAGATAHSNGHAINGHVANGHATNGHAINGVMNGKKTH